MSIDQTDTVDFISIENAGEVLLSISDHLPWELDEEEHLFLLQEKLNTYLLFIESGELFRKFPQSNEANLVINLVGRFPLSSNAQLFLERARSVIADAGFGFRWCYFPPN